MVVRFPTNFFCNILTVKTSWQNYHYFSDTIDVIVSSLAGSMVATHGLFKGLMKDEMKMAIGNTFLISQGLPAIKPRKLTESLFDLAAKCIKVIFKRILFLVLKVA